MLGSIIGLAETQTSTNLHVAVQRSNTTNCYENGDAAALMELLVYVTESH